MRNLPYLEPGTPVFVEDLEAWEKKAGVKVSAGDAIFLRTGRWARRAQLGPWAVARNAAGYHASIAPWLKTRGVSFIGADGPNDVSPSGLPQGVGLHQLALVAMGVSVFDNLDFERAAEELAKRPGFDVDGTRAALDEADRDLRVWLLARELDHLARDVLARVDVGLEGPAGRGKTTTLIQLAQRPRIAGTPFIVELPAWTSSRRGILEYIAGMPAFQAEGLTPPDLARDAGEVLSNERVRMNVESEAAETPPEDPIRKLTHDVRNSLYAMRTALELLKASPPVRDADAAHRLGEVLEWMERDIGRVSQGVDQLASLARATKK